MKALTIIQPWASLIAWGEKKYETRHWKPTSMKKGDLLTIHAGKQFGKEELAYCNGERFRSVLLQHGISIVTRDNMPRGAVIAIAELVAVFRTEDIVRTLSMQERAFGNYGPRRYAWELKIICKLPEPISCAGEQSLWNWELPINMRKTDSLDNLTKVGNSYYDRATGELVDYQVWQSPLPAPKPVAAKTKAKPQPVGPQQLSLW